MMKAAASVLRLTGLIGGCVILLALQPEHGPPSLANLAVLCIIGFAWGLIFSRTFGVVIGRLFGD